MRITTAEQACPNRSRHPETPSRLKHKRATPAIVKQTAAFGLMETRLVSSLVRKVTPATHPLRTARPRMIRATLAESVTAAASLSLSASSWNWVTRAGSAATTGLSVLALSFDEDRTVGCSIFAAINAGFHWGRKIRKHRDALQVSTRKTSPGQVQKSELSHDEFAFPDLTRGVVTSHRSCQR